MRGRQAALVAFLAVTVVSCALWGFAGDRLLERWHLSRLRSPDRAVRLHSVHRLTELESREALEALLGPIVEREGARTELERELLVVMGEFAIPRLLEAFRSERLFVRLQVLSILGDIGARAAPVIPEIERIDDEYLAAGTIEALAKMGPDGVSALLRLASSHESDQVRLLARAALVEIGGVPRMISAE